MVPWLAFLLEMDSSVQLVAKTDMNLCSLPRFTTIAIVKSGDLSILTIVVGLWPPKCYGPIVEVGSQTIIIVVFMIIIIITIIITSDTGKSEFIIYNYFTLYKASSLNLDRKGLAFSSFFGAASLYDEVTVRGCQV